MNNTNDTPGSMEHDDAVSRTETEGISNDERPENEDFDVIDSGQSISPQPSQDIHTSSPRPPAEYPRQFLIEYAIRQAQPKDRSHRTNRSDAEEKRVEQEFDFVVIDYAKNIVDEGGFPGLIERGHVIGLILANIRKLKMKPLGRHFNEYPETLKRLDIDGGKSSSRFTDRRNELLEEQPDIVEDAAQNVLYAVYRTGHDIPRSVWEAHDGDYTSPLELEERFAQPVTDELE